MKMGIGIDFGAEKTDQRCDMNYLVKLSQMDNGNGKKIEPLLHMKIIKIFC